MRIIGNHIVKAIEFSSSVLDKIGMFAVFFMMFLIFWDVIARYLFNSPLLFADEMSGYLLVCIGFLGAAGAMKQKRHIHVDVLVNRLKTKIRIKLELVTSLLSLAILFIFLWHSYVMVYHSYVRGVYVPSILQTPIWIPQSSLLIGTFFLILQYIIEINKSIKALKNNA